jgi:hypothetical protein
MRNAEWLSNICPSLNINSKAKEHHLCFIILYVIFGVSNFIWGVLFLINILSGICVNVLIFFTLPFLLKTACLFVGLL